MNDEAYILQHIKELCAQRNWSNYTLAEKSGLSRSTISNLFKRTNQPTFATLYRICNAFGITISQFFDPENCLDLTPEQQDVIKQYNMLDSKNKIYLNLFMKFLYSNQ